MNTLINGAKQLGINLKLDQIKQFEIYYRELVRVNKIFNLTSVTTYEGVQLKHYLDSLSLITAIYKLRPSTVIDVGSGAGFPGLPLKIALSHLKLTLLEATLKKTMFLESIINLLSLKDVEIVPSRAETAGREKHYRESYDIVVSRAVAKVVALAELCLPFVKVGGYAILQKKRGVEEELVQASKVIRLLGGQFKEIKTVNIQGLEDRCLVLIEKMNHTPILYPRRPGLPVKNPIL
jgi:16S rRNA (guanine527-N7)-methyltransferase